MRIRTTGSTEPGYCRARKRQIPIWFGRFQRGRVRPGGQDRGRFHVFGPASDGTGTDQGEDHGQAARARKGCPRPKSRGQRLTLTHDCVAGAHRLFVAHEDGADIPGQMRAERRAVACHVGIECHRIAPTGKPPPGQARARRERDASSSCVCGNRCAGHAPALHHAA
jgi:hypothetical protein